jgi:superfamily II DNA or RNA helicase
MAEKINLRPYQLASIEGLREGARRGHRAQVLMAPTGAGKTVIGAQLSDEVNKKGRRAAFVVDRVNLVDQTSALFDKYGIPHGVIQADHWRKHLFERIQICSAQTIEKRGFFPDLDLLIVDECHATRRATANLIKNRTDLRVIGLSATPFSNGLADLYTNLVNVCTTNELVSEGFLVPLQTYAARAVDMTGAKIVAGE